MKIDKTLSELWNLRGCYSHDNLDELKNEASETAFMAINTIQRQQRIINILETKLMKIQDEYTMGTRDSLSDVLYEVFK